MLFMEDAILVSEETFGPGQVRRPFRYFSGIKHVFCFVFFSSPTPGHEYWIRGGHGHQPEHEHEPRVVWHGHVFGHEDM